MKSEFDNGVPSFRPSLLKTSGGKGPGLSRTPILLVALTAGLFTGCGNDGGSDPEPSTSSGPVTTSQPGNTSDSSDPNASESSDTSEAPSSNTSASEEGSSTAPQTPTDVAESGVCARDERLGTFTLYLDGARTLFTGSVYDAVSPLSDFEVLATAGGCELLGPRVLSCDPACPNGEICGGDNTCVPRPTQISVGDINLTGLAEPWEITPNGITLNYSGNRSEPNPGFEHGDEIGLTAAGADLPMFTLSSWGVAALTTNLTVVPVESGSPVDLVWDASAANPEQSKVLVTLTVNVHGSTTQWIECMADDTGSLEIPAPLVTELVDLGLSGFPIVEMQRLSASAVEVGSGCVDFRVSSGKMSLPLEVEGLISCSDTQPCPDGQTCNAEKACETP